MSVLFYYESRKREQKTRLIIYEDRCDERLKNFMLFIIRVKREVKRVYRNGCRYNERLNAETGGSRSKTPRIHWVARVWNS